MPTLQTRNDLTTNHMKNTKERWNSRHLILDLFVLHCWSGQWRSKIGSFARDRQWDLGNAPPSKSGFAQSSRRRKWRRSANNAVELTLFPATVGSGGASPSSSTTTPARFVSYIEILSDRPGLWDRYAARSDPDSTMLPKIPFDQFQVGLQYFILTRAQALAAAGGRQLRRRFRLSCKKTQSLLSNLA